MGIGILIAVVFIPFVEGILNQSIKASIFAPISLKVANEEEIKTALGLIIVLSLILDVVSKVWLGVHLLGIGLMYGLYNLLGMFLPHERYMGRYLSSYISFLLYSLFVLVMQGLSLGERFGVVLSNIKIVPLLFSVLGTVVILGVLDMASSMLRKESTKSVLRMK